jgi:hypothetical protein
MSKRQILILIGTWIIILPFLGFPEWLKTSFFAITGIYLTIIGYTIKLSSNRLNGSNRSNQGEVPFVEHKNTDHSQISDNTQSQSDITNSSFLN